MKRCLILAALPLALLACADEPWKGAGTVVRHEYDDDDSSDYWQPGVNMPGSCSGTPPVCTPGIQTPGMMVHHHEPERWVLVVAAADEEHGVSVPRDVYDSCLDGMGFDASTMVCDREP
jgi:hypothetical protein